jgi:uncharacterized membrane protein
VTRLGRPWPLVVVASVTALGLAGAIGAHSAIRGVLALWFFLTCPGIAVVGLLDVEDRLGEVVCAVAVSIAIGILAALAMVLAHAWSPSAATVVLALLSVAAAGEQWRRGQGARG